MTDDAMPAASGRQFLSAVCALVAVGIMTLALFATPAQAAKVMFGTQDHLVKIQDVDIKGPAGETLYLGHKYAQHAFIAPYMLSDDGYILGVAGQNRYYKLDAKMIEQFQASGKLPKPLPPYEISIIDYLFGYLLWIVLAVLAVSIYFGSRKAAKAKEALPLAETGLAHEQAGQFDLAIADYDKALAIAPKHAEILCRRGSTHHKIGNFDRAIADFSKAMAAAPKDPMPLLGRGATFEAKAMPKQALDDYSRAIKFAKTGLTYYVRGLAYLRAGEFGRAIADLTAAIEKEPTFAAAYQNRAYANEQIGQQARANADHRKFAELAAQPAG